MLITQQLIILYIWYLFELELRTFESHEGHNSIAIDRIKTESLSGYYSSKVAFLFGMLLIYKVQAQCIHSYSTHISPVYSMVPGQLEDWSTRGTTMLIQYRWPRIDQSANWFSANLFVRGLTISMRDFADSIRPIIVSSATESGADSHI